MHTIEIDFEVFKKLTSLRETEAVTYNEVVRSLLGLQNSDSTPQPLRDHGSIPKASSDSGAWVTKGVTFPAGTEFRANYKGELHRGRVESGALVVNGKRYESPSAAAVSITENSVNGWGFWECRMPGSSSWQFIKSLRKRA